MLCARALICVQPLWANVVPKNVLSRLNIRTTNRRKYRMYENKCDYCIPVVKIPHKCTFPWLHIGIFLNTLHQYFSPIWIKNMNQKLTPIFSSTQYCALQKFDIGLLGERLFIIKYSLHSSLIFKFASSPAPPNG